MTKELKYPDNLHDDSGEYPSEESLEWIRKYDCFQYGVMPLVEFVESIWWASDWGFNLKGKMLYLSTGGWSGNEDIISALKDNFSFWFRCWLQSRRGGHYKFSIPKKLTPKPINQ